MRIKHKIEDQIVIIKDDLDYYTALYSKTFEKGRLWGISDMLSNAILKCIIYKDNSEFDLDKCIYNELCFCLSKASHTLYKGKLSYDDYRDQLFGSFGDEITDRSIEIDQFYLDNFFDSSCLPTENPYSKCKITDELIEQTDNMVTEIIDISIPVLMEKESRDLEDWYRIIKPIFDNSTY